MKLFLILLAVIFSLSACLNLDFKLPDIDFGGFNGGSVVFPPSDDPDVPSEPSEDQPVGFDLKNWHVSDHDDRCSYKGTCDVCGTEFSNVDDLNYSFTDGFSWGQDCLYLCSACSGNVYVKIVHCYVNGTCHDCGFTCRHEFQMYDPNYLGDLPDSHPFKNDIPMIYQESY